LSSWVTSSQIFDDFAYFPGSSGESFYGFRVWSDQTGDYHYGWALISTSNAETISLTVHSYAYEDQPGAAIHIPDAATIPEPSIAAGLAGLAAGAAAVLRSRRKKKTQTVEDA